MQHFNNINIHKNNNNTFWEKNIYIGLYIKHPHQHNVFWCIYILNIIDFPDSTQMVNALERLATGSARVQPSNNIQLGTPKVLSAYQILLLPFLQN